MKRLISAIVFAMTLPASSVSAECYFIALHEFHVTKQADLFSMGNFSPLIALEPGRYYPLAPEYKAEAPHAVGMQGRKYYIPRYLIDDEGRFSLRLMMLDLDTVTPDDLVLPPSERTIPLTIKSSKTDTRLVTVRFAPFSDDARMQSNPQRFTFEISKHAGPCDEDTAAGRLADRNKRKDNDLRRLHARIMFYDRHHPVGGHEYLPYRNGKIDAARLPAAMARAFDVARVNALELIALGKKVRSLQGTTGFKRVWSDYARLVRRLFSEKIQLRYRNKKKEEKKASAPSLAFHPEWKNLPVTGEPPVLPKEWGITTGEQ